MTNDKSKSFEAIEWARSYAPTVLKSDGKPDGVAMHVLLILATYADGATGKNARPSQDTLATGTRLSVKTVAQKLAVLERDGLIAQTGLHGPEGWQVKVYALQLNRKREDDGTSAIEEARERAKLKHAARQKKYRDSLPGRHAVEAVTPSESVTQEDQHAENRKSDAFPGRHVTPSEDARDAVGERHVTPSEGEYLSVNLSLTSQEDLSVSDGRSTGRAASGSKLPGCAATADAVPEEDDEWGWAEKLADEASPGAPERPSPAVVAETKDGEDEELAAESAPEVAPGPEMDQFMRDALEAEKEQQARHAAASAAVPAAPKALSLDERTRLAVSRLPRRLSWWTPNQVRSYLVSASSDTRAMARLRDAGIADLAGE